MKTSLLLLSLALSITALFAQNSPNAPGAFYSSVGQYTPLPLSDKVVELHWEQSAWFPYSVNITGKEEVALKKGQNLIISIQNPNAVSFLPKIGEERTITAGCVLENICTHYHAYAHLPSDLFQSGNVVSFSGQEANEINDIADLNPIIFHFQASQEGSQNLNIYVDEKGTEQAWVYSHGRLSPWVYSNYSNGQVSLDTVKSNSVLSQYSFSLKVTVK